MGLRPLRYDLSVDGVRRKEFSMQMSKIEVYEMSKLQEDGE